MNRMPAIVKMYYRGERTWVLFPWLLALLPSFIINWVIGLFVHTNGGIYTGGLASIYICTMVAAMVILHDTFTFAIGFNARRTDYFMGIVLSALIFCAGSALLLLILSLLESDLIKGWGVALHYFNPPYISDTSTIGKLWFSFALLLHMYFFGFVLASVKQRFGNRGLLTLAVLSLPVLTLCSYWVAYWNGWLVVVNWFAHHSVVELAFWLMLLALLYVGISYLLLRKATI